MVMQGGVVSVPGIDLPVLVVSRTFYNESGKMLVCPIVREDPHTTMQEAIDTPAVTGYVLCDNIRQLDWKTRGYHEKGRISAAKLLMVLDSIQSILEYI